MSKKKTTTASKPSGSKTIKQIFSFEVTDSKGTKAQRVAADTAEEAKKIALDR